jgi:hypothetical protein
MSSETDTEATPLSRELWPLALLWLVVTLAAYLAGRPVQRACGGSVFASAVLIRIALMSFVVLATR